MKQYLLSIYQPDGEAAAAYETAIAQAGNAAERVFLTEAKDRLM